MTHQRFAIVTGGTSGIGLAVARELLAEGCEVTLWARNPDRGRASVDGLNHQGLPGWAAFHPCDVSDAASVQAALMAYKAEHDQLDVLVNAAGVFQRTPLAEFRPERIASVLDIVLTGTVLTTTALAPCLARSGCGVVVNIGSVAGQHSFVGLGAYGAAKAGVAHFTRTAAQELLSSGVRVCCVCPGVVKTALMSDQEFDTLGSLTPAKRLQSSVEVARFIAAVARPEFRSLTGAVIDFDDGLGLFATNRPPAPLATPSPSSPSTAPSPARPPKADQPNPVPPVEGASAPVVVSHATSGRDGLLAKLTEVLSETFDISPAEIQLDTGPEEIARWDSLGNLRLIVAVETAFGCSLDVNDIMEMTSVGAILRVLEGKAV